MHSKSINEWFKQRFETGSLANISLVNKRWIWSFNFRDHGDSPVELEGKPVELEGKWYKPKKCGNAMALLGNKDECENI